MGDYLDQWSYHVNWNPYADGTQSTSSHPIWITSSDTGINDQPFEWTTTYGEQLSDLSSRVLDELKTTTNGWPNTSDLIAAFMDKLNVEWESDEDEIDLELTFDELMGFEKSEEDK